MPVGDMPVPPGRGFDICKTAQRCFCVYPLRGCQDPAPGCTVAFWLFSLLSHIFSLLWLAIAWSALWNSGRSWRLNDAISCNQDKGDTESSVPRILPALGPQLATSWPLAGRLVCPEVTCHASAVRYSASALTTALPCSPQITWWDSYFDVCGSLQPFGRTRLGKPTTPFPTTPKWIPTQLKVGVSCTAGGSL